MSCQPVTGDPIPEPLMPLVSQIESKLPKFPELVSMLQQRDGAYRLASLFPQRIATVEVATPTDNQLGWEWTGQYYMRHGRFHEALAIINALYQHMILYQQESGQRVHKGMPLIWMSDCYSRLQYPVHAKRYLMLTLCEDAIRDKGQINLQGGPYFRLVWSGGLTHEQVEKYMSVIWKLYKKRSGEMMFPERVLQDLDQEWMTEYPSLQECGVCAVSTQYVSWLLDRLGTGAGRNLERLAHYLVGSIPGFRARMRVRSPSTDYDVVAFVEGYFADFRADLGRYVLCECKDWNKPADFSAIAKFSRVLQSIKAQCGLIFSKVGTSGEGRTINAERELLKVYQGQGIIILVVSLADLQDVARGRNFLGMLRSKYETVRLDLQPPARAKSARGKRHRE
jgi:hypothetical protein